MELDKNEAFRIWGYNKKQFSLSNHDDQAIIKAYKSDGPLILEILKKVEKDCFDSKVFMESKNLEDMFEKIKKEIHLKYPELNDEIVNSLSNEYCFGYK